MSVQTVFKITDAVSVFSRAHLLPGYLLVLWQSEVPVVTVGDSSASVGCSSSMSNGKLAGPSAREGWHKVRVEENHSSVNSRLHHLRCSLSG